MSDKKMITIFSMKLAGWLMYKGFVLVAIEPAKDNSGRNVFHFNNSKEIQKIINEYKPKKIGIKAPLSDKWVLNLVEK